MLVFFAAIYVGMLLQFVCLWPTRLEMSVEGGTVRLSTHYLARSAVTVVPLRSVEGFTVNVAPGYRRLQLFLVAAGEMIPTGVRVGLNTDNGVYHFISEAHSILTDAGQPPTVDILSISPTAPLLFSRPAPVRESVTVIVVSDEQLAAPVDASAGAYDASAPAAQYEGNQTEAGVGRAEL
eukprot:PLAT1802.2.p1 GENE.PLAT1802.2~~PLAT1802.2.p1  ORF type:complete len:180 (+),score=38.43 PLAT1802.2:200-739(+)